MFTICRLGLVLPSQNTSSPFPLFVVKLNLLLFKEASYNPKWQEAMVDNALMANYT